MKKQLMIAAAAALALVAGAAAPATAASGGTWNPLAGGSEPDANPLKGFVPYQSDYSSGRFPTTMEWFYEPLSAVLKGADPTDEGSYDWSDFNAKLAAAAGRGHQVVTRFYLDYPQVGSGMPEAVRTACNVKMTPYTAQGNQTTATPSKIPDYTNSCLMDDLVKFATHFGAEYKDDHRIGFLQTGLVGFWGEWHNSGTSEPLPSDPDQQRLQQAFVSAFPHTQVETRYPASLNTGFAVGYHDDSFAYSTVGSPDWYFANLVSSSGNSTKWQTGSIGGELRPELQVCLFDPSTACDGNLAPDGDFGRDVQATHVTWLLDDAPWTKSLSSAAKDRAIAGAMSMGYSLQATDAYLPASVSSGESVDVKLKVKNIGVAPFYYNWPIKVALVGADRSPKNATTLPGSDISTIQVGQAATEFDGSVSTSGLASGTYKVIVQAPNSMDGGAPVQFANRDRDTGADGWLTLGDVTVG